MREDRDKRFEDWATNVFRSFDNVRLRFVGSDEDWATDVFRSFDNVRLRFGSSDEKLNAQKIEEHGDERGSRDEDTMTLQKSAPGIDGRGGGPPNVGGLLGLSCIGDFASWNLERGLSQYFGSFQDANSLLTFDRTDYFEGHVHEATLKRA
jgi:hypothetical protein